MTFKLKSDTLIKIKIKKNQFQNSIQDCDIVESNSSLKIVSPEECTNLAFSIIGIFLADEEKIFDFIRTD